MENVRSSKHVLPLLICLTVLLACFSVTAQVTSPLRISGTVVDSNGSVISAAHVVLKSFRKTTTSTTTNSAGEFELFTNESSQLSLVISARGFNSKEIQLESTTAFPLHIVLTPGSLAVEVTVTATRTPTELNETGASVVLLNSNTLRTTAATTLDDTLRQVAGFSLFRRSGSRTANPTSQGVSLRATGASGASRALVLADGVPLNDPFGGWVYWDRIPRESINEVEVLLGGASHLYGSAALGGVIDISTRRINTNSLSLATSYGNETTPSASLFASGTKQHWSGSIAAEVFHTNGYVLVPEDERGRVDTPAGTRNLVFNLAGERAVGKNGKLFARASSFGESRENGTPLQTNRTHLRQFVFGGSEESMQLGSLSARIYGGTQVYDQNFSAISADRNSETLTRVQRVAAQVIGATAQWSRAVGSQQTLVVGFEGREVRGASDEIVFVNSRATSLVGAGGREREAGFYFEDLVQLGSRLFLNLGARLDHWRNFAALLVTRPVAALSPTNVTSFPDRTENAFSPHGSVVYRFNDHIALMASMSRAFRAPTLNELYRSFRVGNVLTLANENLRAERLTGGEVGLRATSVNDRVIVRGSFFWNEITRPVANVTLTSTPALITRQRQNLGRTRSRGVELQSDANLSRHWVLSGAYLFADARVIEFPSNSALEGLWLPQVPRHQFTVQTRYDNPSMIAIGLQARASSSQFDDDQNQFRLSSYFTLDAMVSRRLSKRLEIFGAVENVFNQRYEVGKTPITTLGPPILFRVGMRIHLGSN